MKREGQGATDESLDSVNDVFICTWYDNKRVIAASDFVGKEPIRKWSRYNRKERKCIDLPKAVYGWCRQSWYDAVAL